MHIGILTNEETDQWCVFRTSFSFSYGNTCVGATASRQTSKYNFCSFLACVEGMLNADPCDHSILLKLHPIMLNLTMCAEK